MPLILGANTLSAGGYEVDNSLRFNRGSSDYLSRTPASSGNRRTWTFSTWVKRSSLTGNQDLITSGSALQVVSYIYFYTANGIFAFEEYTGGYQINIKSNAYLRDLSAWYNLIIAVDTTQGTASNRIKMYINGNQVTSLSASTYPSQNFECNINSNTLHNIGCEQNGTNCIDGYLAETVFIDGQQLAPSDFGEFDEDSGIWKPIDVSDLTFGTNGFYLEFKDSSALGDDTSGNGNDWTVNNLTSIDQTTDTPTNNFATMNPIHHDQDSTASISSIGVSALKLLLLIMEFATTNTATPYTQIGVLCGKTTDGDKYLDTAYTASGYGTSANGNILGFALDLDSGTKNLTITKNGAAFTGGSVNLTSNFNNVNIFAFFAGNSSSAAAGWEVNYGSPMYAGGSYTDGAGFGNFSYAVPQDITL
jgi:hypothetical protein